VAFGTYDCTKIIEREMGYMFSHLKKCRGQSCTIFFNGEKQIQQAAGLFSFTSGIAFFSR